MSNLGGPASTAGLRAWLAASASAVAFAVAGTAAAQEPRLEDEPVDTIDRTATGSPTPEDEVTVTGSRIRRDEFTSAAPIQVIDPELGALGGTFDTGSLIQSSSVAAGSAQITAAISSIFVTNGGQGASTISLRGLGAERTLVLLNGRRAGPAGTRGAVNNFDLNVLPQSIVNSIDILKTGASSVYGSDAVAGVVNIITARDTDGFEIDGFISQPTRAGGEEYQGALTWGKSFDRGHLLASFDYYRRQELARGDRKYLNCSEERIYGTSGNRNDVIDPRTGRASCRDFLWGHVWLYDYSYIYSYEPSNTVINGERSIRLQPDYGDNLGQYIPGLAAPLDPFQLAAPAGFFPVGYDAASFSVENSQHPFTAFDTVVPRTERFTFYLDGAYELTESIEVFGEILLNRRSTYQNGSRQFWQFGFTSQSTLPAIFFGVPSAGDPFAPGWTGDYLISPTTYTNHSDTSQRVDYGRFLGGIKGSFGSALEGWNWNLYAQHSRNIGKYRSDQILDDAVDSQDFRTASCAGTNLPISGRPCIDINWTDPGFLSGYFTPEQRAFLFDTEEGQTKYRQTYVEGYVDGKLFDLPAGDVSAVLGAVWRRDFINDTPGAITLANNAWGNTGAGITTGSSTTKEIYAELSVPVFADAPFARRFEITASGRYTDVSTAGDKVTYGLGAEWQVTEWLKFRGSYGTSFRAPALFELYLADQTSFIAQRGIDPCINWGVNLAAGNISQRIADNCAAGIPALGVPAIGPTFGGGQVSATVISQGGLGDVGPETSNAKTASIVLTPPVGDSTTLQFAVDWFDIEVKGEISQLGAADIVFGCYDSDFFPTDPLCTYFTRGQTAAPLSINEVRSKFINVNNQRNRGVDFTFNLDRELPGEVGEISFLLQATRQLHDTIALFAGNVVSTNGEDGEPKWVGDAALTWDKDEWIFFYGVDFVGRTSDVGDYLDANTNLCDTDVIRGTYCLDVKAEPTIYHSVSATRRFSEAVRVTVGVANLFDEHPPAVSTISGEIDTIGASVFTSNYDSVGRRIFANIKATF